MEDKRVVQKVNLSNHLQLRQSSFNYAIKYFSFHSLLKPLEAFWFIIEDKSGSLKLSSHQGENILKT